MEIKLDADQEKELTERIINLVKTSVKQAIGSQDKPYKILGYFRDASCYY